MEISSQYFVRQEALPSIGSKGLSQLRASTVGIAGAGGVGSSTAHYLSRSGIGRIILVDQDIVEPSNLLRIHSARQEDLFHPKAEVVSRRLSDPGNICSIEPVVETITNQNVDDLYGNADIVIDGLDNFRTRYLLNDFANRTHTPYLFASAVSQQAHVAFLNPPRTPCLQCFMPRVQDRFEQSCETLGVSPTITGLAGAFAANEAIRYLTGQPTQLSDHLLTIDASGPEFLLTKFGKREDCTTCGNHTKEATPSAPTVTYLCGEHTANVLPPTDLRLTLSDVAARVAPTQQLVASDSVLVFRHGPFTVSLFRNGRLLIGGVDEETKAEKVAEEIWEILQRPAGFGKPL